MLRNVKYFILVNMLVFIFEMYSYRAAFPRVGDNPPNGYDLGEVGWLSTLRI